MSPDAAEAVEAGPAEAAAVEPADASEADSFPGEACAAEIDAILAERSIQFAAGAATLTEESGPVIEEIGAALRGCPDTAFEIGGHTNSQGSESGNLRLSQERAEAVLAALRARGAGAGGVGGAGLRRGGAGRRQRHRRGAGAEPAHRLHADCRGGGAGRGGRRAGGGADAACVEAVAAIVARRARSSSPPGRRSSRPRARRSSTRSRQRCGAARTWRWRSAGTPTRRGPRSGNERLSQQRAEAVLAALRERGLALPEVTARGYGESRPVADNATAEGRAREPADRLQPGGGRGRRAATGERRWIAVS